MGSIVEATIALSVAYVGVENLVVKEVRHRWRIGLAFGLVHGFGLAAVLRELDLERGGLGASLLGFSIGVELGLLAVLALLWPLLQWVQRSRHRLPLVRVASGSIAAFGAVWFLQRIT
jgi:hypothetical protein